MSSSNQFVKEHKQLAPFPYEIAKYFSSSQRDIILGMPRHRAIPWLQHRLALTRQDAGLLYFQIMGFSVRYTIDLLGTDDQLVLLVEETDGALTSRFYGPSDAIITALDAQCREIQVERS